MASSSTNKQPLLVDRPLHEAVVIGGTSGLSSATNLNTPIASGLTLLVDCAGNDGAVLDSVSVLITESSTTQSTVALYINDGTANYTYVGGVAIPGGNTLGTRVNVSLPPLSIPVPNLASPAATMATYPSETDKKNTGLLIPAGKSLYAGVSAALTAPSAATRVVVAAQGGYY